MNVSVSLAKALTKIFDYAVPSSLEQHLFLGSRVKVPFGQSVQNGFIIALDTHPKLPPKIKLKEILGIEDNLPYKKEIWPYAQFLANTYANTLGEVLNVLKPAILTSKILEQKEKQNQKGNNQAMPALPLFYETSPAQQVKNAFAFTQDKQISLFYGSSKIKEEASLYIAHKVLSNGGQVLILVPDILSCAKIIEDTKQKLGPQNIQMWHSKVLLSTRKKTLADIFTGKPCVIVGTRSACLLPFKNLKLTIMFFEEDKLFKQEEMRPYYHAREAIIERANIENSKVILVSSSPSFEALKLGKLLNFDEENLRSNNVKILPIEYKTLKNKYISPSLELLLEDNFARTKQSLLLINRIGYSGAYACLFCKTLAKCKKCGAILSHKQEKGQDYLVCKKCGEKESLNQICPVCKNQIFRDIRGGTQAVEEELKTLFKTAKILRIDSQSLAGKNLKDIDLSSADFIIGTNLALRANFKNCHLALASILETQTTLNSPDFRATEHFAQTIFNLKTILTDKNARLIIQTANNEDFDFKTLENQDYLKFSEEEMAFRKEFNFPPYAKVALLFITAKTQKDLNTYSSIIENAIKNAYSAFIEIEGPVPCGVQAKNCVHAYFLVKAKSDDMLSGFLQNLRQTTPPKKVEIKILPDPYNFF